MVYPGTLFSGHPIDFIDNAKGQQRGFVLVEFEKEIQNVEFIHIPNIEYVLIEINAQNKKIETVDTELKAKIKDSNVKEKLVIIHVEGELSEGKTTEVNFSQIKDELIDNEALYVSINRNQFSSREYNITGAKGSTKDEIETNVFTENIGQLSLENKKLLEDHGVSLAKFLLKKLGQPKLENEKEGQYEDRMKTDAFGVLEFNVDDS